MNAWPDELWNAEHSRMSGTPDPCVNDAVEEIDASQFITEYIVPWVVIGASLILCCSAVMALVGATAGASASLIWLRRKGFGSDRGRRHTL